MYERSKITKVFLYLRKSTDESSGKQVRSIADQREACLDLAMRLDLDVVGEFKEDVSAYEPGQRPEFNAMLKALSYKNEKKRMAEGILAWHPDRLSRNPIEAGKVLHMIDKELIKDMFFCSYMFHNSPSGKEHLFMEFARAKGYSDKLSRDVTRGLERREQTGALTYGTKFGYKKTREFPNNASKCSLYPIPSDDFGIVKRIFELRLDGHVPTVIRKRLKAEGYKKTTGGLPAGKTILGYLNDPFYYGKIKICKGKSNEREYDLRKIPAPDGTSFVPAVSEDDFWECQYLMKGKGIERRIIKHQHALSGGLITCGSCKKTMYPAQRTVNNATNKKQLGYECQTKGCAQKRIRTETVIFPCVEENLKQGLSMAKRQFDMFVIGAQSQIQTQKLQRKKARKRNTEMIKRLERDMAGLEQGRMAMVQAREFDDLAKSHYNNRKESLKNDLQIQRDIQSQLHAHFDALIQSFEEILELSQNAHQYWRNANDEQKHRLAKILFLNLTFKGDKLQSSTMNSPFKEWRNTSKKTSGGHAGT